MERLDFEQSMKKSVSRRIWGYNMICCSRASNLGYVMYRMGLLAVLRARYKKGKLFIVVFAKTCIDVNCVRDY